MNRKLLVRVDSGPRAGRGHLMRSIALAQAWQDAGGSAAFIVNRGTGPHERLTSENIRFLEAEGDPGSASDAAGTAERAVADGADWVIVDGYCFSDRYQRELKDRGLRLLATDDTGLAGRYCADVVLNQNPHATPLLYSNREPYTELLLGSDFVLLRREFLRRGAWERSYPETARRILITMGGGAVGSGCLIALQALALLRIPDLEAVVTIGEDNGDAAAIDEAASRSPVHVETRRATADMSSLMAWADFAIANAGSTAWELCFLRLPSALMVLADNQAPVAERLAEAGGCVCLGRPGELTLSEIAGRLEAVLLSAEARARIGAAASRLVDGRGASRVVQFLLGHRVTLRRATADDCELLWRWANDPQTRRNAFSTEPIPWDEHVAWFRQTLENPRRFQYLAFTQGGQAVGQVRVDVADDGAGEVGISVDPQQRGRGYGARILKALAAERPFSEGRCPLRALVKTGNAASSRAFEKAGFIRAGEMTVRGCAVVEFIRPPGRTTDLR